MISDTLTEVVPDIQTPSAIIRALDLVDLVPLNVLIIYEDAPSARRAMRMVCRLAAQTGDQIDFKVDFWRFDLLEDSECGSAAMLDALAANMVIVTTREDADLPPATNRLLERCIARRSETKAAVVALFGSGDAWSMTLEPEFAAVA
jgi:hypothetical protein